MEKMKDNFIFYSFLILWCVSKGLYNVHFACPTNAFDTYGIIISY